MISEETQFAINHVDEIYRIELSAKNGNKMYLNRVGNSWFLNNNYLAEGYRVQALLEFLNKLEVESNVSELGRKSVIKQLAINAIKVSILDKNSKEIKTFYAGGDASSKGTYMILEQGGKIAENPYIVNIPGYQGQLIYNLSLDTIKWRSAKIFDAKYETLSSVEINYFKTPQNSFRIDIDEDEIVVKPLSDSIEIKDPIDREKIVQFLTEIESKSFEYYANHDSLKPIILGHSPICKITTKSVDGAIKSITLYDMPIHGRSLKVLDDKGKPLSIDEERFYGLIAGRNDFVVGQYYVFGPLLKKYAYFFKKEKK